MSLARTSYADSAVDSNRRGRYRLLPQTLSLSFSEITKSLATLLNPTPISTLIYCVWLRVVKRVSWHLHFSPGTRFSKPSGVEEDYKIYLFAMTLKRNLDRTETFDLRAHRLENFSVVSCP